MKSKKHRLLLGVLGFLAVCVVGLVVFIVVFAHQAEVSGVEKAQIGAVVGRYAQQVEDSIMGKSPESETSDEQKQVVARFAADAKGTNTYALHSVSVWPYIVSITKTTDGYTVIADMNIYFKATGEDVSSKDNSITIEGGSESGGTDRYVIKVQATSGEEENYSVVDYYLAPRSSCKCGG
jgi:hypothetical protein